MNGLQIFRYEEQELRTVEKDGALWWVLKDVCEVLGLSNPSVIADRLDEDERAKFDLGRQGEANIINEAGLYNVILRSDKPEAKKFKRWVTHEVLPSVRKHGAYMTEETLDKMITSPEFGIKLLTALKDEQDKRKALEAANAVLTVDLEIAKPKADYFDQLVDRNLLTNFRETAKQLEVPPKKFIDFLLEKKYLYRDKKGKLIPYESRNNGLFEVKEFYNEKSDWSGTQTLVTPKGRETFRLLTEGIA